MAITWIGRWRYWLLLAALLLAVGTAGVVYAASAQGPKPCTNATVRGAYGFAQSGAVIMSGTRTDWAAVGRNVFDGKGSFVIAKATVSVGGTIVPLTGTGTYKVNTDCTMTLESTLSNGQTNRRDIVIVDNGREMFTIATDPNWVTTGHMVRQGSEDVKD